MSYPKIETLYGLYSRKKFIGPPGLCYVGFYGYVQRSMETFHTTVGRHLCKEHAHETPSVDQVIKSHQLAVSGEYHWFLDKREEFLLAPGLVSTSAFLDLDISISAILERAGTYHKTVRVVFSRDSWVSGIIGAYVSFFDITTMPSAEEFFEAKPNFETCLTVQLLFDSDPRVEQTMPPLLVGAPRGKSIKEALATKLAEVIEAGKEPTPKGKIYSEGEIRLRFLNFKAPAILGALSLLLHQERHRYVERRKPLVQRGPAKNSEPFEPVSFLVGKQIQELPRLTDGLTVQTGKASLDEGQLLIDWPVLSSGA